MVDTKACKLLNEAFKDEEDAIRLYKKISNEVSVMGLENLTIVGIKRDEEKHHDMLSVLLADCFELEKNEEPSMLDLIKKHDTEGLAKMERDAKNGKVIKLIG